MNPRNGLRVKAYKDAMTNAATDHELVYVARWVARCATLAKADPSARRYLLQLVNAPDFTQLDHSRFKKAKWALPTGVVDPVTWMKRDEPPAPPPPDSAADGAAGEAAAGPA